MSKAVTSTSHYFLFPSTVFAASKPQHVQTILGSCIAVCTYDKVLKIGGINHYMLPWWDGNGIPTPKYGDVAITQLIDKMLGLGSSKSNIVAKVFGGANRHFRSKTTLGIGDKNINTALIELRKHRIEIIAQNTGGELGRKILFDTATGQVLMKFLEPAEIVHDNEKN